MIVDKHDTSGTIQKSLFTARLVDGFWERWLVHGVEKTDIDRIRPFLTNKENWIQLWSACAEQKEAAARQHEQSGDRFQAEAVYRKASLYYQLTSWLLLEGAEKTKWTKKSIAAAQKADRVSAIATSYESVRIGSKENRGRVRTPLHPHGLVIMINPIDSAKEELFLYEMDFAAAGFVTFNFDGPGQGETAVLEHLKASTENWEMYVSSLIYEAKTRFPALPIYLFGTSSGAAWSLYGSCHPAVSKAIAVSPAFSEETVQLPDYFTERIAAISENGRAPLPSLFDLTFQQPVYLFHGKQDVMVSDAHIHDLFTKLPPQSKLKEYSEEGHCCNFKLTEIRQIAITWFVE